VRAGATNPFTVPARGTQPAHAGSAPTEPDTENPHRQHHETQSPV